MKEDSLAMLTQADWALLQRQMSARSFQRGTSLLQEGARERRLLILRSGSVRVERLIQGRVIVLREVGPGEVLGEIGFIESAPASASVVAQEACVADVIEGDVLQSLIASDAGFAVRFYHSLAVALARRTRTGDVTRIATEGTLHGGSTARTGNLSPRQLPVALEAGLQVFEREMLAARKVLRRGSASSGEAARVATACDAVVKLMDTHTQEAAVTDIGYSDLLAFRDPDNIDSGIGDAVFRETFSTFMLSATMARCHAQPRGFPEDHDTVALFHRNEAAGDDWTGPLVDRWFLDRPLMRSRRDAVLRVAELLVSASGEHGPGLRVTSLACGQAAEVFAFFERRPDAQVLFRCVDLDPQALLAGAQRAQAYGLEDRVTWVLGNALSVGEEATLPHPQNLVYSLGLCDYLDDAQVVALLDHCNTCLLPNGQLLVSNLRAGQPDRRLMQHLLSWPACHRLPAELLALWQRSSLAGSPSVEVDGEGVALYLSGRRAGPA